MTKIEEAAARIENGWCAYDLERDGKYCSVGSMARSLDANLDFETKEGYEAAYDVFDASPEGRALAQAVLETEWATEDGDFNQSLQSDFDRGFYSSVVYSYNDSQDSMEPVLEMFRMGNKIFTEVLQPA